MVIEQIFSFPPTNIWFTAGDNRQTKSLCGAACSQCFSSAAVLSVGFERREQGCYSSGHHSPIHECQIHIPTDSSSFQLVFPCPSLRLKKAISILCSLLTLQKAWQVLCLLQEQAQKQSSSVSLPALLCTAAPAQPFHRVLRFCSSCQHGTVLVPVQFKWNISLRDQQWAHGNDSDY